MTSLATLPLLPPRKELIRAMEAHDRGYDGVFFAAVRTTGIFCRPSCQPPRAPKSENLEFFATAGECARAGYRPCKLCRPLEAVGAPPSWVAPILERIAAEPSARITEVELRKLNVTPERARRWFREQFGLTFAVWGRQRRLGDALDRLRQGASLDDVAVDSGFESHSGFREAVGRELGDAPGRLRHAPRAAIRTAQWESPVGTLNVAASAQGVCLLEFADRRSETSRSATSDPIPPAIVTPGQNHHLETLRRELDEYFAGRRRDFTVPLDPPGTSFQQTVWSELQRIPFGQTCSYAELAERMGKPKAMRAVARANAQNRIVIVIPCHRVIGANGTLTGYGGGLWRKRLLLELEHTGHLPGSAP